jgi:uncharacterized membrane protein YedE/YeeE
MAGEAETDGIGGSEAAEETFIPVSAAIGGVLIGLSAALVWIANGRIAGASDVLEAPRTAPSSAPGRRVP